MIILHRTNKKLCRIWQRFIDGCWYIRRACINTSYDFKNTQTLLLTIGFYRSGSSLIGYLLTAHPDIIMADEPTVYLQSPIAKQNKIMDKRIRPNKHNLYEAKLNKLFGYFVDVDRSRYIGRMDDGVVLRRGKERATRYLSVPNQWQGRSKSLKVIGAKHSQDNVDILVKDDILKSLKSRLEDKNMSLKFIFTVRNPYDILATHIREHRVTKETINEHITNYIKELTCGCENNTEILKHISSDNVYICRNEDIIANPRLQLSKLCSFLEVSAPADYLDACAAQVIDKPTRSRFEVDWSPENKQQVASLIERYDFFSGYDWQS